MKETIEKEFLSLLGQYISIIVKIVNVYTYNTMDKKDLMSDIVFELWRSYPKFRGDAKVSTWLYRVALNTALKTKRKRDNNKLLFLEELITFENETSADSLVDRSEIELLYKCIEKLSPMNKAMILLYLEDKSNEEIAEITGFSRTNVSTRLNRIKGQLKICLEKNEEYEDR
ncbi:sigma-70 family RNA polymerase sigma factor [Parabacteroides sp. OttesenSCG-928-G07]|nr:sigma-70 family RNA polymerase sigma factor [Parabacteroides sp. OttesenSCG-928-G21]MDL2278527.1 sigma-70 family RNA polymerase sigma factor [Parabacteroides sp. OttesenSCG-928-G07]